MASSAETGDDRRAALIARLYELGELDATETAVFQQAAAASYGLGVTDMKALGILLRDGARSAGELAAELSVTTGAVTGVVDRLVERKFARRVPDQNDRRKVVVETDDVGVSRGENVYRSIGRAFTDLLADYSTEQLQFLVRHYEASIALTKRETEKLRQRS